MRACPKPLNLASVLFSWSQAEFARVLADEIAIAGSWSLNWRPRIPAIRSLQKRFALAERKARGVAAIEMQEIEDVTD